MPTIKAIHFPSSAFVRGQCFISPGWPDWEFIGPRGRLYREFKGTNDNLSGPQREFARLAGDNDADWAVWWPKDLRYGGRAEQELRAIA